MVLKHFQNIKQPIRIVVLLTVAVALSVAVHGLKKNETANDSDQAGPRTLISAETLQDEQAFQDYMVRIYRDRYSSTFEIWRDGERIYVQEGHKFQVGNILSKEDDLRHKLTPIPMGMDINGDGEPDLVVSEWTGGAHCCFLAYVFQIGKTFRQLGTIDAGDGNFNFVDLDGDSKLEVVLHDWTFAYWNASFADSPAPKVILRFENDAYRVAGDLMRESAPTHVELAERAQDVRSREEWQQGRVPSDLWRHMLDLIYTGHPSLAWQFFDMAWPPEVSGKAEFLAEFRAQLAESPYWPEVKAWFSERAR